MTAVVSYSILFSVRWFAGRRWQGHLHPAGHRRMYQQCDNRRILVITMQPQVEPTVVRVADVNRKIATNHNTTIVRASQAK